MNVRMPKCSKRLVWSIRSLEFDSSFVIRASNFSQRARRAYNPTMNILVIGCSLNPDSNSQILAREAAREIQSLGAQSQLIDLREQRLSFCDGATDDDMAGTLAEAVRAADAIVMAVPIYNYDVNAAAKNMVEHVSKAFEGKLIAFMCAAGGQGSYMSVMSLA